LVVGKTYPGDTRRLVIKVVVNDYSQLELRVLAHLSQDPLLCGCYCNAPEKDVHILTAVHAVAVAQHIKGVREPDWADPEAIEAWKKQHKQIRDKAKPVNFGIPYGATAYTLQRSLGCSEAEAKAILDAWYGAYNGVTRYFKRMLREARELGGMVRLLSGRFRRLPEMMSPDDVTRHRAERQAKNVPMQGGAADIVKRAMLAVEADAELKTLDALMLLQVHDELVQEAPEWNAEAVSTRTKQLMRAVGDEYGFKVPLLASGGVADSWGEAK
jgi:DNA polymerase-1